MYAVMYKKRAEKDMLRLPKQVAVRILDKVERLAEHSDPQKQCKALMGKLIGVFRYRVGNYRVVLEFDEKEMIVLRVLHRREVYKRILRER